MAGYLPFDYIPTAGSVLNLEIRKIYFDKVSHPILPLPIIRNEEVGDFYLYSVNKEIVVRVKYVTISLPSRPNFVLSI